MMYKVLHLVIHVYVSVGIYADESCIFCNRLTPHVNLTSDVQYIQLCVHHFINLSVCFLFLKYEQVMLSIKQ